MLTDDVSKKIRKIVHQLFKVVSSQIICILPSNFSRSGSLFWLSFPDLNFSYLHFSI